jgi:amino acid adenylation domain-containing protein
VHELVSQWVKRRPNLDAVSDPVTKRTLSYRELWQNSGWLAGQLARRGIGRGDVVAIALDRGTDLVVAMLGIIRAGAAYLPVDRQSPVERVHLALAEARVSLVIGGFDDPRFAPFTRIGIPRPDSGFDDVPMVEVAADDPIYLMYTSGSTGVPKGVLVPHRAVHRLVVGSRFCTVEPGHRVGNGSNPAFDATTFEIWGALAAGGCAVVLPSVTELPIDDWVALLVEQKIDALFLTTSLFHMVVREQPAALRCVGTVVVGGEQLELAAVRRVLNAGPPARLVNGYGPTETTTFAAYFDCTPENLAGVDRIPIGFPLQNTTLHVLDDDLAPAADGATGELCIGGSGVALGYVGRDDLTAARFVTHPTSGERLYRSGDIARRLPGGAIEVLGRNDRQVKLRGFRIELEEIESAVTAIGLVDAAFVEKVGEGPSALLAAAVLPAPGRAVSIDELVASLARRLPEYMIPTRWQIISHLPLGPTGKVDRAAISALLADPGRHVSEQPDGVGDPVLASLTSIWQDVLGSRPAGSANFIDMGGNSLMAVQVAGRVQTRLGVRTEPHEILLTDSLAGLAEHIRTAMAAPARGSPELCSP